MKELQENIEFIYSKKNIADVVRADIDPNSPIIQDMIFKINRYLCGEYSYASKVKRVAQIRLSALQIAEEIAVLVLPIKEISPIQAICSALGAQFGYENRLDGVKTAAELLAVCEGELYTLYHSEDYENETGTLGIKPNYQCSQEVKDFINNKKYLPPMLVEPRQWTTNNNGGHLLGSGSVILKPINQHQDKQCLDVINKLQSVPWELNTRMLEFVEESKKALDTLEKKRNFERLVQSSEEVYRDLLDQGNRFYFVWKFDFRGRMYSQGYHVNPQSNSYKKAIINFANKTTVTDEIVI